MIKDDRTGQSGVEDPDTQSSNTADIMYSITKVVH